MQIDQDFIRRQIRKDLAQQIEKNPRYSLRAYSKKVGLSPSFLSRFLNAQKNISLEQALRLSRECDVAVIDEPHQFTRRSSTSFSQTNEAQILQDDAFKFMADWYHFPILELISSKKFKGHCKQIARRLGLSTAIVAAAIDRLENLGLIKIQGLTIERVADVYVRTTDDISSAAQKRHHQQMLQKASEALFLQKVSEREFQSLNFNFKKEDISKAKKRIRQFVDDFNAEFSNLNGEDVYQLNMQFFNLTDHDSVEGS